MAALPNDTLGLDKGIVFQEQPDLTWRVNPDTGRITGMADGYAAVKQAVEILFSVERFRWQIYSPHFGMQWEGLIGQNPGYAAQEIQRRAIDAIKPDQRMTGISQFSYTADGERLTVGFVVNTVYGDVKQTVTIEI